MGLFRDASIILANSFHGTAFAINFNRPFISFYPGDGDLGTRQRSILQILRLEDRAIEQPIVNYIEAASKPLNVNFSKANAILEEQRRFAKEWLAGALAE